ncbi:anti-sigma factor antagonist [Pseudonocardia humida]|uniref:Anti-sigma factor antagonist n=1 Tax=Pseudonocardia humida TaxID=2800819 RepID=A0ABT0ZXM9_9PSEU|nr:anti-sigma factor antagonist [Pseudonocardia humida]MCO1655409.1 anti-sigma factor antagonist [Pseudonocardia humida]
MKPAGDERTSDGGDVAARQPPVEQLMTVRSVDRDASVLLVVEGAVDGLTAPRLRTAVADAFDRLDGRALVLDLSSVTFLGSPGLRTLFDSASEAVGHRGHRPLRVVVDHSRPVIRPIEIVGLDNVLALYHDVDEALRGDEPTV